MAQVLFVYPPGPQGDVYVIPRFGNFSSGTYSVELPSSSIIAVEIKPGSFPVVREVPLGFSPKVWKADLVLKGDECEQTFSGNWKKLTGMINAAAAVNKLFTVYLSPDEYARLKSGAWANLLKDLSTRAQSLIRLEEDTWNGQGGPALELLRVGRCP